MNSQATEINSTITQERLRELIESSDKKIFSVDFIKMDGSPRTMVGMLGVKKHLKGGESTTKHCRYLITCFDMQKKAYRCINLETVTRVKVGGIEYSIGE